MKKWMLLMLMSLTAATVLADTFGNFTYRDDGTSITITGYVTKPTGVMEIPATLNGKPVTDIGSMAFIYCSGLTSVVIPAGVTNIADRAFMRCYELNSITIPPSVNSVGDYTFSSCWALTSITIPASVNSMGDSLFSECSDLTNITVEAVNPNYSSESGVLFDKSQTTLIQCPEGKTGAYDIPSSVTSIGDSAFSRCWALTSVTIPASVNSIGTGAFMGCCRDTFSVDAENSNYRSVDGVLFDKDQKALIQCPYGKVGAYTIPSSVTSIESSAFYGCSGLTSVTIPEGVTSIEYGTFYYCSGLTSVTIPYGITRIEKYGFGACGGLTSVTIPSSVTFIGNASFYACGFTNVTIPASVTSIDRDAFFSCRELTNATFMGNAPTMSSGVFNGTASGFAVYYYDGSTGFASPTWMGYPSFRLDAQPLSGFALWADNLGLVGDSGVLFSQDRNEDGVPNGFEYTFGTNRPAEGPLLRILRTPDGRMVVETPAQDEATLPYVTVHLLGSTNLVDWTLPVTPTNACAST